MSKNLSTDTNTHKIPPEINCTNTNTVICKTQNNSTDTNTEKKVSVLIFTEVPTTIFQVPVTCTKSTDEILHNFDKSTNTVHFFTVFVLFTNTENVKMFNCTVR